MIRRVICSITLALLLGIGLVAGAQAQSTMATDGYLDEFVVHVKQSCTNYDAIVKKLVTANHANGGDNWLTLESTYGEGNVYRFVSTRASYGDIETAQGKFMAAISKGAGGEAGAMKLLGELGACAESTQGILRRRRWDLSIGQPADAAAYAKVVGNARWIRVYTVHVRPGMGARYEAAVKMASAAMAKANPDSLSWFSQSVAGDNGTTYYISQLRPSLASFDGGKSMSEAMGADAFAAYQKEVAEVVTRTDTAIYQISGSLSNAPDEVAAVAPNFWRPKPPAPMKAPAANPPAKKN
jgi:hypothetical protein